MGIIYDMLKALDYDVATEAEDITEEVQDNLETIKGTEKNNGGGEATAGGTDNSNGKIDTNTDDVLGTQEEDNDQENQDESQDNMDDEGDGEEESSQDETSENDISSQLQENDNSFEAVQKRKIHQHFIDMYQVISSDIKLIHEFVPSITDYNTIKALTNINANFVQIKDYIYQILTEEFNSLEYPILKKRYVALNHVYDICIRTLDEYFQNFHKKDKK